MNTAGQSFSGYHRDFTYAPPIIGAPNDVLVLHEEDDFLVIHKPSGLLSVPGKAENLQDCLVSRLVARYPDAKIVHRLDMDTSGIMVLARTHHAQRHLGLQFERRHIHKVYLADIMGHLGADTAPDLPVDNHGQTGMVQLPLICDWPNRPLQMVCFERGKKARTDWQILSYGEIQNGAGPNIPYTRIALYPLTGRSHQLRVHMRALGHPILGDRLYAPDDGFTAAPRLMLHAQALSFYRPQGGERLVFTAPSDDFNGVDNIEM